MVAIVGRLIVAAAGALVGAAVAKELDKPSEQREWHGEVGGVPYDFRRPSVDKLRRAAWDPDNPRVIVAPAFGVGWGVNFARVAEWIQPYQAPPVTESGPAPALATVPAAPALPAAEESAPAPAAPPVALPAVDPQAEPAAAATQAAPAAPPVGLPTVDTPATSGTATPVTPAVATPVTPGTAAPAAVDTPATPAAAADTPSTPAGPTDATGDSQG
jgi:hypothetical protein